MAVKVDGFLHSASREVEEKAAEATTHKTSEKRGFFESLLNFLEPGPSEECPETGCANLKNRPASANVRNHIRRKLPRGTEPGGVSAGQDVNNLAASALLALAALSSGQNRIGGFHQKNAFIPGLSHLVSAYSARQSPVGSSAGTATQGQDIGALSARFESTEAPDAIGFDHRGGTSYGTYQISSRAGTMDRFIDYLSERSPALANRLKSAGPANTGGVHGRMPETWKKISREDPERFAQLQHDFIEQTHYLPAVQEIAQQTGVDISKNSKPLQEVLWSTAVQHGPRGAARIFSKALSRSGAKNGEIRTAQLIGSIYDMRKGQFGSSAPEVRAAVHNRLRQESRMALAMAASPLRQSDGVKV